MSLNSPLKQDLGVVVQRSSYGESSLLVGWFTRHHGIMRTLARGAHRPRSPFRGYLDDFFLCELGFRESTRSTLHTLLDVQLCDPHRGLRQSQSRFLACTYAFEVCQSVCEPGAPAGELFELFLRVIRYLNQNDPTPRTIAQFHRRILEVTGHAGHPSALHAPWTLWHQKPPRSLPLLRQLLGGPPIEK